jgi:hypothetical protein
LLDLKRFDSGQLRQAESPEVFLPVVEHEGRELPPRVADGGPDQRFECPCQPRRTSENRPVVDRAEPASETAAPSISLVPCSIGSSRSLVAAAPRARGDIITAASVVVTVPLIVLALLFQRRIISGLTAGAIR